MKAWHEQIFRMYECGHRHGVWLEIWPGDLMTVGRALEFAYHHQQEYFEIFRKLAEGNNYQAEYLALDLVAGELWSLEIKQLQRFLSGQEFMGWHEQRNFEQELKAQTLLYGDVHETLQDGLRLCQASVQTGNPIEFYL